MAAFWQHQDCNEIGQLTLAGLYPFASELPNVDTRRATQQCNSPEVAEAGGLECHDPLLVSQSNGQTWDKPVFGEHTRERRVSDEAAFRMLPLVIQRTSKSGRIPV